MRFLIITAVYNARPFFQRYLATVAHQAHADYEVIVVDDCSTDGTAELVAEAAKIPRFTCILNSVNRGAVFNQVHAIRALDCQPDDVLVFVDGDDRLASSKVLQRLEHWYGGGADLVYGQYTPDPPSATCQLAAPFPREVIEQRSFRKVAASGGGIFWNHLRTMKYKLFAQLADDDFTDDDGQWYQTATDAAFMYPALELAAPNIKFCDEILYFYSSDNPASDWRKWPRQCDRDHMHILGKRPKR